MAPILQVLSGKNAGERYVLIKEEIRMGRHPDCEVQIELNAVSRFHAHMLRENGQYFIEDLASRNGTFVNGKKIEGKTALKDNDRVKICDTLFLYRGSEDSSPSEEQQPEEEAEQSSATVLSSIDATNSASPMMIRIKPEAKLSALNHIIAAIGQTLVLDDLYPKILEGLFRIFPQADRALILLLPDPDKYEEDASAPLPPLIPKASKHRRGNEDTVRYSKTIVEQALREKKAILSADATSDSRFSLSQSITDFRIRSVMCVALVSHLRKPLGVLQVDTQSQHRKFTQDDLQILVSVGTQIAIALENATLHEQSIQKERIERELEIARKVQAGFLPKRSPDVPEYDFWAFYEAAGMVGGDYYDFIPMPGGLWAVVLGDVSGKGIPAALMMAKVSSDSKVSLMMNAADIGKAMDQLNNAICAAGVDDKFITIALCVIDPTTHAVTMVNAGHMSPIVRRADGTIDEPAGDAVSGLPVGILEDFNYATVEITLAPGELVVLYSDGISEATSPTNALFSVERIRELCLQPHQTAAALGECLLAEVRKHFAGQKQNDDMTLVVFGRKLAATS